MRNPLALSMIVLLALAGGCKKNEGQTASVAVSPEAAQTAQELTPEQLGELGAQIQKAPDRAAELLKDHGLTEATFEVKIRKVTEDPDASKRYAEAYRKGKA